MDTSAARTILQALAQGIDPHTGETFPADSPYQHPDTVRALFHVLQALDGPPAVTRRAAARAPARAGKPWSADEDHRLAEAFDAGIRLPELASRLERSRASIEARLIRLGRLAETAGRAPRFRITPAQPAHALPAA